MKFIKKFFNNKTDIKYVEKDLENIICFFDYEKWKLKIISSNFNRNIENQIEKLYEYNIIEIIGSGNIIENPFNLKNVLENNKSIHFNINELSISFLSENITIY